MGRRKNEKLEFRFYELPRGESALALLGNAWVGVYGHADTCLHFHNLFEIGYCHYGKGRLLLGEGELPYEDAMITAIPANCPHSTYSEDVDSWEFLFFDPEQLIRELFPDDPRLRTELLFTATRRPRLLSIDQAPELGDIVWKILEESREKRRYYQDAVRTLLKLYLLELIRVQEDMPEFGMLFKLSADLDRFRYYGLGPEENYTDRQKGARLGIFGGTVQENLARYLVPQECGNRCGVRWLRVTDRRGRGMEFSGDGLSVNVLPYTPHELENAAHAYELPPVHYSVVRVALQQMGVGGDDSWGARTHPEYLLPAGRDLLLRFRFRGV